MARRLPAELKTNDERCWATACSPEAPPRDSVSIEERILWRHVNARHCTRCILEESKTIRFGFSQLCINDTKRHEYVVYIFKRYFQVGSLLQSSRAAALGNSAFFKTCKKFSKHTSEWHKWSMYSICITNNTWLYFKYCFSNSAPLCIKGS